MTEFPIQPDSLTAHHTWLRRLAGELVADYHAAEDLTQETLMAALVQGGPSRASMRTWLAGILRRRASDRARRAVRRDRREQTVARAALTPGTAETFARFEQFHALVLAVRSLDELSREVVLLRFWEDLPPRTIAARLEVPVETGRTRLKRAVERLRHSLDEEHGSRSAWAAPLAGLCSPVASVASWTPAVAGVWMTTNTKTILFAVALLFTSVYVAWAWPGAADHRLGGHARAASLRSEGELDAGAVPKREVLGEDALFASGDGSEVRGRVVDEDGHAAPRMLLAFRRRGAGPGAASVFAATDEHGRFTTERGLSGGEFTVAVRVGRPLVAPTTVSLASRSIELVVRRPGPRGFISGVVVHPDGSPAADVRVVTTMNSTESNTEGEFRLRRNRRPSKFSMTRVTPARVPVTLAGVGRLADDPLYEWGSTGVRLVLRKIPEVQVRAVRADGRGPVLDFQCRTPFPGSRAVAVQGLARLNRSHWPQGYAPLLTILPKGVDLLPKTVELPLHPTGEVVVKVPVLETVRFRVHDRQGQPIVEARVEMVRDHVALGPPSFQGYPQSLRDGVWSPMINLIATGTTDLEGRVDLRGEAWGKDGPSLLVSGAGVPPTVVAPEDARSRDGIHEVTIERGARVRGEILNVGALEEVLPDPPRLVLDRTRGRVRHLPPARFASSFAVDGAGRFDISDVPAGTWQLNFTNGTNLGSVTLAAGADCEVQFDARTLLPVMGELRGSVRIVGRPEPILLDSPSAMTDDQGEFPPVAARAGQHSLDIWARLGGARRRVRDVGAFTIEPGKATRIDIAFWVQRVAVRLVTVDGLPAPFERVFLRRGELPKYDAVADESGSAEFYLPKGQRFDVALRPADHDVAERRRGVAAENWTRLGSFVVGESEGKPTFVVR